MPRCKLNITEMAKLLKLHNTGVTHKSLAIRFGLGSRSSVLAWLKKACRLAATVERAEYQRIPQQEVHDKSWQNDDWGTNDQPTNVGHKLQQQTKKSPKRF